DVPRHDDTNWLANPPEIAQIKAIIRDEWLASSNDLHSIFIIGHVPVPYSGFASPDGHTARPWPCDGYYGDMQGQWTDVTNYATANMAGDGKFDQQSYPAPLSIAVGRVDFALMPALYPDGGLTTNSEVDLLAQYLVKDHRYRCGQFTLPNRAIVGGFFNSFEDSDIYANALNNGSRWFGFDPGPLVYGDLFMARTPCLWGFEAGAGSGSVIYGENGTPHTIADLVNPATEPPIAFYMLKGSYFGEWNIENDLMRAILATPNYGLAVTWTRYFRWHLEALGMGDPIGTGLLDSQNDTLQSDSSRNLYLALMGDPTLRLQLTEPPADLSGTATNGNVFLSWNPSPAQDTQYLVYRSMAALDGPFSPVTSDPIGEDSFVDVSPPLGPKLYQVRALQRVVSGSGSFTNLSQGIFAIVYDDTTPPTTAASVSPSPNPAGWNNTNVVVSITADDGGGSGVASISYSASGATNIAPTMVNDTNVIVAISTQGITTISYFATDADGNSNATQTITVSIDTTPAVVAWGTPTPTTNAFGWNNTAVSIPWTASDALSGLATPGSSGAINFTAEGTNLTQNLTVTDIADNSASFASPAANVDLTPPMVVIRARPNSVLRNNSRGARAYVTIYGSVTDALSGADTSVGAGSFSIVDSAGTPIPSGTFTVSTNGTYQLRISLAIGNTSPGYRVYTITAQARDKAGNSKSAVTTFTVR
ncbi:MAG: hypothetical protein M1608_03135, partial [Candidatus Omnitrophica bacterium]|nr:hypothetical protein [Candidatus Omnitrophota bacterium]